MINLSMHVNEDLDLFYEIEFIQAFSISAVSSLYSAMMINYIVYYQYLFG